MTPSPLMGEGWGEGANRNLMSLRAMPAHPELVEGRSVIARSAAAHGEPVEPRGNPVEVEHTPANHHSYGDEIANPRIKYGVAMTSLHPTLILSLSKDAL